MPSRSLHASIKFYIESDWCEAMVSSLPRYEELLPSNNEPQLPRCATGPSKQIITIYFMLMIIL